MPSLSASDCDCDWAVLASWGVEMERVTWFLGMGDRERRREGVMAPELWTQGAECAMKAYSAMAAAYRVTSVLCSDVQNMAVAGMVVVLVVSGCWVVGGRRATQRRRRAGKGVTTGAKGGDGTIAHTLKAKRIVQQPRDRGSAVVGKQKKTRWDEMRERKRERAHGHSKERRGG